MVIAQDDASEERDQDADARQVGPICHQSFNARATTPGHALGSR